MKNEKLHTEIIMAFPIGNHGQANALADRYAGKDAKIAAAKGLVSQGFTTVRNVAEPALAGVLAGNGVPPELAGRAANASSTQTQNSVQSAADRSIESNICYGNENRFHVLQIGFFVDKFYLGSLETPVSLYIKHKVKNYITQKMNQVPLGYGINVAPCFSQLRKFLIKSCVISPLRALHPIFLGNPLHILSV